MSGYNIEKEAKKVIELYGENTVASDFAKHILNLNMPPSYKYSFGIYPIVFNQELEISNISKFSHTLTLNELPSHTYGAEYYEVPVKDWKITSQPHPTRIGEVVDYYWK